MRCLTAQAGDFFNRVNALKHALRKRILTQRKRLDQETRERLSAEICRVAAMLPRFLDAHSVALYLPINQEVDTAALMARAIDASLLAYLPVVRGESLMFYPYRPGDPLAVGSYGIAEPASETARREALPPERLGRLDLMFLPLVGFDQQGGRLGYGGGYYDRALADVASADNAGSERPNDGRYGGRNLAKATMELSGKERSVAVGTRGASRPWLVGLAYGFQEVSPFKQADHDIPLDAIVTENGVILP